MVVALAGDLLYVGMHLTEEQRSPTCGVLAAG